MKAYASQLESDPSPPQGENACVQQDSIAKEICLINIFHHSSIKHFRAYLQRVLCSSGRNRCEELLGKEQAQWERIHLPMQETQVRSQIQEDPTCCEATKPVHHKN